MRSDVAFVLLVLQAALALLASLGMVAFASLSHTPQPTPPELVAVGGGLVLLLLAARTTSRVARFGIFIFEALTLLGGIFRLAVGTLDSLNLVSTLTTLMLPAAMVALLLGRSSTADASLARRLTAGLLLISGVIHLSLVSEHITAAPALGVLFALDGAAFVGLAVAALANATWWRPPSIVLLIATLLAYLVVVLRGDEEVEDLAVATKLVELLALGLLLLPRRRVSNLRWLGATGGLLLAVIATGTLAWAAEVRPHARVAGASGHSDHSHGGKLVQVVASAPTPEQRAAAETLLENTRLGIARFEGVSAALADGYRPSPPLAAPTVHYTNPAYAHGHVLDTSHPQALVYANTPSGPHLLGAMYMMPDARTPGVAVGGALTEWHVHADLCFALPGPTIIGIESPFQTCPVGALNAVTPSMLHVWTVDNPGGAFGELDPAYAARLARGDA